jgi:hypothetical protein
MPDHKAFPSTTSVSQRRATCLAAAMVPTASLRLRLSFEPGAVRAETRKSPFDLATI